MNNTNNYEQAMFIPIDSERNNNRAQERDLWIFTRTMRYTTNARFFNDTPSRENLEHMEAACRIIPDIRDNRRDKLFKKSPPRK